MILAYIILFVILISGLGLIFLPPNEKVYGAKKSERED